MNMGHWIQVFESVHLLMRIVCKLEKNSINIMLTLVSKGMNLSGDFKYILQMGCVEPRCFNMTCSCICNNYMSQYALLITMW